MVALSRHARRLSALFARFGYVENFEVSTATGGAELQFVRPCRHGGGPGSEQVARVHHGVLRLIAAIDGAPKSLRWRLRAHIGTRAAWHSELDDQE